MANLPKPPKVPCGSCPYRKDAPSGIWARDEYEKLPQYDGETMEQFHKGGIALFFCHQNDGCLCGGWLMTHDRDHLVALRMHPVDASVWDYSPAVEVFASGQEAHDHGVRDLDAPTDEAHRKMSGILKLRRGKDAHDRRTR